MKHQVTKCMEQYDSPEASSRSDRQEYWFYDTRSLLPLIKPSRAISCVTWLKIDVSGTSSFVNIRIWRRILVMGIGAGFWNSWQYEILLMLVAMKASDNTFTAVFTEFCYWTPVELLQSLYNISFKIKQKYLKIYTIGVEHRKCCNLYSRDVFI
jgi:hypothetical protein